MDGFSSEAGCQLCVSCGRAFEEGDKLVAVYRAERIGVGPIAHLLGVAGKINASARSFPLFAHLKCPRTS